MTGQDVGEQSTSIAIFHSSVFKILLFLKSQKYVIQEFKVVFLELGRYFKIKEYFQD